MPIAVPVPDAEAEEALTPVPIPVAVPTPEAEIILAATMAPIAETVTDHVTVEAGAGNRHAARPIAGLDWDIAEAKIHIVRRLAGGRELCISVRAVAQSSQAPTLGVPGGTVS
jgi:hypothetical protein